MKYILHSQIFLSFLKGLRSSSLTSDKIKSFKSCFYSLNYFEYSVPFEYFDIILQLNLISLDDLYQKLIGDISTFFQLMNQHISDPFFAFYIHSKPPIININCSLNCFDGKIFFIFETVLQQYQQKHSFPEYISFITFLISQYFSQKIEHNKDQLDIISKEITQINQKIVELTNQSELDSEINKMLIILLFDLIYQLNDKSEM
jgi:hypothetical protein